MPKTRGTPAERPRETMPAGPLEPPTEWQPETDPTPPTVEE